MLGPLVRFILDSNDETCYCWAAVGAIHVQAFEALKKYKLLTYSRRGDNELVRFFTGDAKVSGGALTYKNSDIYEDLFKWLFSSKKGSWDKTNEGLSKLPDRFKDYFPEPFLKDLIQNTQKYISKFSFGAKYIDNWDSMNAFTRLNEHIKNQVAAGSTSS